jgi:KDO2-lipid IV(A) lauroyltransferase
MSVGAQEEAGRNRYRPRRARNQRAVIIGMLTRAGRVLVNLIVALGLDNSARVFGRLARLVAPAFKQHRMALENIAASFPERSRAEHRRIRAAMWDNLGRMVAESVHFDELTRIDKASGLAPRVSARGLQRHLEAVRQRKGGAIYFSAHLANWELVPAAAAMVGVPAAILFREPLSEELARGLGRLRETPLHRFVDSDRGAAFDLANALERGEHIGVMMDLKWPGPVLPFLGRPASNNPIVGRLARAYDVPIYGVRVIREPSSHFLLEVTDALDLPRDAEGRIDADGATEAVNTMIEGWVSEYPEHWFWVYDRWRDAQPRKNRRRRGAVA